MSRNDCSLIAVGAAFSRELGLVSLGWLAEFQCASSIEIVARELGIDYAGFDVAMVDGHPFLLVCNLLYGNQVLNAQGIRLGAMILEYLERRLAAPPPEFLPRAG